jgi:hypothetical protein
MAELHYAFIKNNRVENIAVFAEKNDELANQIVKEHGFDQAIWVNDKAPQMFSSYDGKTFTAPTHEYLIERGIVKANDTIE